MFENVDKDKSRYTWVLNERYRERGPSKRMEGIREELEWMKRQIEYATFAEKYKLRYDLKKGEIYEFDWGLNVNSEFSSRHLGVVLSDSSLYNPLVLVCPLKSKKLGAHPRSDVDLGFIKELQSTHETVAVVNQVRSIDKLRLFTKKAIGSYLPDEGFVAEVDATTTKEDYAVPRLEERKLKLIIDAYFNIILYGDSRSEVE